MRKKSGKMRSSHSDLFPLKCFKSKYSNPHLNYIKRLRRIMKISTKRIESEHKRNYSNSSKSQRKRVKKYTRKKPSHESSMDVWSCCEANVNNR